MVVEYKIKGLSKPNMFTFETEKQDIFWSTSNLTQDRFNALFNYCKHNWDEDKIAVIKCDSLSEDGIPINSKIIEIKTL